MKVIIVGAGRIGRNLAKSLSDENNEVYVIEKQSLAIRKISEKLDVQILLGSGSDPETLIKAKASAADLILAVTTSDETNLVVCSLAAFLGAKRCIARVRNLALSKTISEFGYKHFHIDEIINPELLAADAIVNTVEAPGSRDVANFCEGKVLLRAFDIAETSPLSGQKLESFKDEDFPWPFLIIAIIRDNEVIFPKGSTVIEPHDHVYAMLPSGSLGEFLMLVNPETRLPRKVVIHGASITGKNAAEALSKKIKDIIVIEEDSLKARQLADELEVVRVINGSASDVEILTECGIEAADFFVATTINDHTNLVSSVLAKKMGARHTIISTQQPDYLSIIDSLDIDAIINPHRLAVKQILHLAREKNIRSVTKFLDCDAEALELIAESGSPVTKDILMNIVFPKNAIVGAIYSDQKVTLAKGHSRIEPGHNVIVFCQPAAVKKVQKLFAGKN